MFSHQHNQVTKAILKTLAYADLFEYPLTISELHRYLYKYRISLKRLSSIVKDIPEVAMQKGYITFIDRKKLVDIRKHRTKFSMQKIQDAQSVANRLAWIPGILCIAVSGSVGANNAKKDDDIDFFIITKRNQLWLTRFFVTLQLKLLNKKRAPHETFAPNMICTNLWVTPKTWVFTKRTLFIAREIAQLKVVVNKYGAFEEFLSVNKWILDYFPNIRIPEPLIYPKEGQNIIVECIDRLMYRVQLIYMRRKRTTETISYNFAAFHPGDGSYVILKHYMRRVRKYLQYQKSMTSRTIKVSQFSIKQDLNHITPGS